MCLYFDSFPIYILKRGLYAANREPFLACICVFFIFVWFILALYIRYSLVKAIFFRNCVVDEGGGWLCIVLHLLYLRGFINRVLSSCGLYKTQSVELISFYLGCGDAETWNLGKKLAKNGFAYRLVRLLVMLCFYLFFVFTNISVKIK